MLVGLISDTHDNVHLIAKAVKIFNERKVDLVLHAGDHVSPFVPKWFRELRCRMIGVFGNNERERELLARRYAELGHEIRGDFAYLDLGGKRAVLLHGHEKDLLHAVIDSRAFDIIVYGHTHEREVRRVDGRLIVNPGEACGYLTGEATIALLRPETLEVEVVYLS